jgi:ISXO2 transposase-like protein/transposase-like zinc ribbon protein
MFRDERDCFEFVLRSRWPEEASCGCSSCGGTRFYRVERRLVLACAGCKRPQSATAGTVMHGTHLPLSTWLLAAWILVTDKRGVSAKQLQRQLGIRYETAYMVLQRLRAAMVDPDRSRLHGAVEVDETFVGGVRHGRRGREMKPGKEGKFVVAGAVEVRVAIRRTDRTEVRFPARLRLRLVSDKGAANLLGFVKDVVDPGTNVWTDASPSYAGLDDLGFPHGIQSTSLGMPQSQVLPHLHLAFSNLKTWLAGTFHGRVEAKHLQGYLNEFCFRFNRRDNLFAAFQTLLSLAPKVTRPAYADLYSEGPERFLHPNPRETTPPYGGISP